MPSLASIAALAALSCPLLAGAATCPQRAAMPAAPAKAATATSPQLIEELEGVYRLSNGRRLDLVEQDDRLWADFGKSKLVPLEQVAPDRLASPGGAVTVEYRGRNGRIVVHYPADEDGRLAPGC
ncbi:hypothetical protein [Massilia sp. KIM]|uniref:hypothetical protein n=1 Tax=Massilia sp. KIM TaxID=1955422 RepID=UPI00117F6A28|nr:hypothetical protein [Massilia sp. KIM]